MAEEALDSSSRIREKEAITPGGGCVSVDGPGRNTSAPQMSVLQFLSQPQRTQRVRQNNVYTLIHLDEEVLDGAMRGHRCFLTINITFKVFAIDVVKNKFYFF